ncbi:hypothetical protein PR002_g16317 [Phytophthora rubi]|uniref:Uncharacterized protein n=1 Tax=Phytophthora rubi TaxID=129364 RepID=A0A6A3KUC0_9STRA|nr:hypothetical protein PR002_g16317 [Phytophthora rubi]
MMPEFMDVFCEKAWLDEMHPMQSDALAADLGARAISHCEMLTTKDSQATVAYKPEPVFAVVLPTNKFILKLANPPAREHDRFWCPCGSRQ